MRQSAIICIFLLFVCVNVSAEEKVARDASIDQLKVFDRYVGDWTFTMKSADGIAMTGEMKTKWIHGGKLIRQSWTMQPIEGRPAASGESVMTFDVPKNVYRQWSFNSFGHTTESTGKWDYEKQTMIWTGEDSHGNSSITRSDFKDKDTEQFQMSVKDADGASVIQFEGTTSRR